MVRAVAVLALALPTPPAIDAERLGRLGFKIGLLVHESQQVAALLASREPSVESGAVTQDLAQVFGRPPGYRWVGRVFAKPPVPSYPAPSVAEYTLELRLTGARQLPQLIAAPSRYGNEASFGQSHLTALWLVKLGYSA